MFGTVLSRNPQIRERSENKPYYVQNPDEIIARLKNQVEWQKLDSWGFRGFKFFLLSKKLPKRDARRFLRQELERLKVGTARFFQEAEKYGLEKHDDAIGEITICGRNRDQLKTR